MLKIPSQHKESIIGALIIAGFVILALGNAFVLLPALQLVYGDDIASTTKNPINTEIVNDAIEVLDAQK